MGGESKVRKRHHAYSSRFVAACLALVMLLTVAAPISAEGTAEQSGQEEVQTEEVEAQAVASEQPIVFKDVENSYAKEAINRLASLSLISGVVEDQFYPQNPISRQDVAVLLSKVIGMQPKSTDEALYEDVPLDSPYAPYVYTLAELEVLKGRPDNQLGGADPLTRQELAVILTRLMKAGSIKQAPASSTVTYEDAEEIADYAKDAIVTVTNQRWMTGANSSFRPLGIVTRAEAAVIAERVLDARYQQAENAKFALNTDRLNVMAGSSERLVVKSQDGEKLPFTPVFAFDRPELGAIMPDGTFVAGPTVGTGNVTVTLGFHTVTIPVQITQAAVSAPDEPQEKEEQQKPEAATEVTGTLETEEEQATEEATPAEEAGLVNIAPESFTSVKTVGPADNYFSEVEKQYPGPVGGLSAVSEEWTGFNRQYGRKATVALPEGKAVERVTLTFQQRKTSGITLPPSMEVEVSQDGKSWSYAGKVLHDVPASEEKMVTRTLAVTLPELEARYVRVTFPVKVFVFARQLEVWAKDAAAGSADGVVLLPPLNLTQPIDNEQTRRPVENMLLAYTGMHDDLGTWTQEDFLPMVGYLTQDGYMRDQMFDTVLLLPYQTMPATRDSWNSYLDDLFRMGRQLDALNSAMREYNRLRGTLYSTPTKENVVLAIPYPNANQKDFGVLPGETKSLSFNPAGIGEQMAFENRKKAVEWYFDELQKRWNKAGYSYLHLDGIYWFHELIEDSAPKERELIRSTASMVHDGALRFYWIPYFGAPGVEEWKSLYFDRAFLQPNYYSDKPVTIERIEGVLDAVQKYGMDIEIEGDHKMYNDPKFYQLYYNQLTATHKAGMDKNNVHAYYYGSKTLLNAVRSKDEAIRAIYDDTYKWMRGRYDRVEFMDDNVMP